jgi:hypothetical protein
LRRRLLGHGHGPGLLKVRRVSSQRRIAIDYVTRTESLSLPAQQPDDRKKIHPATMPVLTVQLNGLERERNKNE